MNHLSHIQQTMSSRDIAEITGKPHNDLLKAIRKMETAWERVTGGKFSLSEYEDNSGRKLPMFNLTKKESLFIATKFNDDARAILINRWEELELANLPKQLSTLDFLQHQFNMMKEQEQRVIKVENKVALLEAKTTTRPDYFTIVGYGTLNGIPVNLNLASTLGKKATAICKRQGIETDTIPDPRFGKVKLYPTHILETVFNETIKAPF